MASVAGVRLAGPDSFKGKPIGKRIELLKRYVHKVERRTRGGRDPGLSLNEALDFVRHFRPAFGNIVLMQSKPDARGVRVFKVAVDNYVCKSCRFEFDEKDVKGHSPEGILCPKCATVVAKVVRTGVLAGPERTRDAQ
jgi:hypothetical protein